jgi:catechol 2,3-dioxygenase-like lactoylglutathione lyase family enzyme
MLPNSKLIGFALTNKPDEAREFYEKKLGLPFVSDDGFALVFDSGGNMIRIAKAGKPIDPLQSTVLGWEVPDIEAEVKDLSGKGVTFERYGFVQQNEQGIWDAPGGARIVWFKDPDGNVLSLSQHPAR